MAEVVAVASAFVNSSGSLTATFPGGHTAAAGNVLVAVMTNNFSTGEATIPTGWTEDARPDAAGGCNLTIASTVAAGGETGATYTMATRTNARMVLTVLELSGVERPATSPSGVETLALATSSHTVGPLNAAGFMVAAVSLGSYDLADPAFIDWSNGFTTRQKQQTSGGANNVGQSVGTLTVDPAAATESTVTWSASAAVDSAGALVAYPLVDTGTTPAEGSASGQLALSGSATGATSHGGTTVGPLGLTGGATGETRHAGSTTGGLALSGTATGSTSHTGSTTGQMALDAAATGATSHDGHTAGALALDGSATGQTAHVGQAGGSLELDGTASGTTPTVGGASGSTAGSLHLDGTATGRTGHSGATVGGLLLDGSATGSVPIEQGGFDLDIDAVGPPTAGWSTTTPAAAPRPAGPPTPTWVLSTPGTGYEATEPENLSTLTVEEPELELTATGPASTWATTDPDL